MAAAESSRKKKVFIGRICRAACCHRLDGQVVEDGGCKAFMGRSRAIRVPNFEASDLRYHASERPADEVCGYHDVHPLGSLLMPGSSGPSISPVTSVRAPPDSM